MSVYFVNDSMGYLKNRKLIEKSVDFPLYDQQVLTKGNLIVNVNNFLFCRIALSLLLATLRRNTMQNYQFSISNTDSTNISVFLVVRFDRKA